MVEDLGYDAVDINLGCPAKKVVKCGGSGLLRDLPLLEDIFKSVRAAVNIPLTIKLRAGWDENSIVAVDVRQARRIHCVEAVAVHPAHARAGYKGAADWEPYRRRQAGRENPGHRQWRHQPSRRRCAYGPRNRCDAVMIGRAAATNPWIFSQMRQHAETGRYDIPADEERYRLLMGYYRQINAAQLPDGVGKMKQFACWFTHGVGNGGELRSIVHAARTPAEILESVERFFEGRAAAHNRIEDPAHGPAQHLGIEATLGT